MANITIYATREIEYAFIKDLSPTERKKIKKEFILKIQTIIREKQLAKGKI